MRDILLIRHGESEANAGLRTTVPAEVAITELGLAQAQAVADYIIQKPSTIVISPYLRTKQTAQPLIEKFADVSVVTWEIQEFTYLAQERCRNSTYIERKPMADEYWTRNEPAYCDGAGAESFAAFWERARQTATKIKFELPDNAVIFCHAQLMRAILWLFLEEQKVTPDLMQAFYLFMKAVTIPNAAIVRILVDDAEVYTSSISTAHLPPQLHSR